MPHRFDVGVNTERLIWAMVDRAIELPTIYQRTSHTLTLRLGPRALGWALLGQSQLRPGPPLDLTAASQVRLIGRQFPQRPAHIEREGPLSVREADLFTRLFELFNLVGTVTDPADGAVDFTMPKTALDAAGRFLLEPRVKFTDGTETVPRHLKVEIIPTIEL